MNKLISKAQKGDEKAIEELITLHTGYIYSIARKYLSFGIEIEELYQEGIIGFLLALKKYDNKYETKFLTFASYYIKGQIHKFANRKGLLVNNLNIVSLDETIFDNEDDNRCMEDIIINSQNEFDDFEKAEIRCDANIIMNNINSLTEREVYVVKKHIVENKTLAQIGEQIGLSPEGVRKIEKKAIIRIKNNINKGQDLY